MSVGSSSADIVAALHAAGVVEVDPSTRRRAEYSSDASLYRMLPKAVVFPRTIDDLVTVREICATHEVPLTIRGAGTSIAGNAVGPGVVADVSRHLHRIDAVDAERRIAVVQPGVVLDHLQAAAAADGLRFGPDPSTHSRCTIGGMIGNNACGTRALAYGRTADNVVELEVLTGAGEHLTVGSGGSSSRTINALQRVVERHRDVIRAEFGRFTRQISGYSLEHLLNDRGFDVGRMLVGTEGTCAIVLGATVRLVEVAPARTLVVLGYPDMAAAADAVPALLQHRPIALEGLDARIVATVLDRRGAGAVPPLPDGQGWLFAELAGPTHAAVSAAAGRLVAAADAIAHLVVTDRGHAAALWRIREDGAGLSTYTPDGRPRHAGWEDSAVPPHRLGDYLRDFDALLADHGLTGVPYGHFGDGCLHVRIDFPLDVPNGGQVFRGFLLDAARLVTSYGGSMSGEHGDGRARSELLPLMYSPAAIAALGDVKAAFDPAGVLNPGVILEPDRADVALRSATARPVRRNLAFAYTGDGGDLSAAVHRCIGMANCRGDATATGGVMCPSYLATRDEKDSTRGRARVLQEMVNGSLKGGWRAPEVSEALDLCLSCKGCLSDCPTSVDMATYKAEVLHQAYRRRLRPMSHYALGWLPLWVRLAALAPGVTNRLITTRGPAAIAKRVAGIDARRSLPELAPRTFQQWFRAQHRAVLADDRPVVGLWVDTFTNHFAPHVGTSAVVVLEAAGFAVQILDANLCCGLTWISTGQLGVARQRLRRSVDVLEPLIASGVPVVGLEPSCTAVFRHDAEALLPNQREQVRTVAAGFSTLAELLNRQPDWSLPALEDLEVVAQPHCHQRAVMGWRADRALLERAGCRVQAVGGCCGLAGNFGFEQGHYDVSTAVAGHALLPAVDAATESTVVLADGFSCRTQLAHLRARRGVHLAELLARNLGPGPMRQ